MHYTERSGNRVLGDIYSKNGGLRYCMNRSSSSTTLSPYYDYWDSLQSCIESVKYKTLYQGSIYAYTSFSEPYPQAIHFEVLTLAFIQLLEQYAYQIESDYLKLTTSMDYRLLCFGKSHNAIS